MNPNYAPSSQSNARTIAVIILLIACFIAAIVGFGGPLHELDITDKVTWKFFATKVKAYGDIGDGSDSFTYDDCGDFFNFCEPCLNGGRGVIAMGVLTLIASLGGISLGILRVTGRKGTLGSERALAVTSLFGLLLLSGIWGGSCYKKCTDSDLSVKMTGLGYIIACIFFNIAAVILLFTTPAQSVYDQTGYNQYVPPQGQPGYNQYPPQGQPGYIQPQSQQVYTQ